MSHNNKGMDFLTMKESNQRLILKTIKKYSPISRADLSKKLGISAPTISKNADYLIEKGLIYEAGIGISSGGRKPVELAFNFNYRFMIALIIRQNLIRVSLANLDFEVLAMSEVDVEVPNLSADEILHQIKLMMKELLIKPKLELDKIACISLSVPGVVETNNKIKSKIIPQINGHKLAEKLRGYYQTDVIISNDTNAKAVASYFSISNHYNNVVYLSTNDYGVGGGLILNGKLYKGSDNGAGEFGDIVIPVLNRDKQEITYEIFESIVSKNRVTDKLISESRAKEDDSYKEMLDKKGLIDYHTVRLFALDGNNIAIDLIHDISQYYALVMKQIVSTLNPDVIILGGTILNLGGVLYQEIIAILDSMPGLPVKVEIAENDCELEQLGAFVFGEKHIEKRILEY